MSSRKPTLPPLPPAAAAARYCVGCIVGKCTSHPTSVVPNAPYTTSRTVSHCSCTQRSREAGEPCVRCAKLHVHSVTTHG